MSERLASKVETAADRTAACASLGSRAVGNCVECPAAIGCPILQLKQRSQEMVTATAAPNSQSADISAYGGGGDFTTLPQFATAPVAPKPTKLDIVRQREAAAAAKKQKATEQAMRERLRQAPKVSQPGRKVQPPSYLSLLLDSVTDLVVAISQEQK